MLPRFAVLPAATKQLGSPCHIGVLTRKDKRVCERGSAHDAGQCLTQSDTFMKPIRFQSNSDIPGVVRDRNDCTVRALMTVTGATYGTVEAVLSAYGRKVGRGFAIYDWLKSVGHVAFGKRFVPCRPDDIGTFLIGNRGHVWAIVNGVMHDYEGSRASRYVHCFEVVDAGSATDTTAEKVRRAAILDAI